MKQLHRYILLTMANFSLYSSLSSCSLSCSDPFKKLSLARFLPPPAVVSVGREKIQKLIPLLLLISLPVH